MKKIPLLTNCDWPGNIRELQNVLERSAILSGGNALQVAMPELIGKAGATALYERSPVNRPTPEGQRF